MKTFIVVSHGERKFPYEYLNPSSAFKVVETRNADFPLLYKAVLGGCGGGGLEGLWWEGVSEVRRSSAADFISSEDNT